MEPFTSEDDEHELDTRKPLTLLLGSISHEGVVSVLSASGRQYKQKYPESKVQNWGKIIGLFDKFNITVVIWKLSYQAYHRIASPEYKDVVHELLSLIKNTTHAVYIHTDLLDCDPSISESSMWEDYPNEKVRTQVKDTINKYGLDYLPYSRNAELTVLASNFISDTEQGLLLRLYIPQKRMWSQETGRLLQLFRDYIEKVSKLNVRLDQTRTDQGTIYEFHGEDGVIEGGLSEEFSEFSNFIDICVNRPDEAEMILRDHTISHSEISDIITRFSKEARRLQVDFKHERERKLLSIRQRMESELTDVIDAPHYSETIEALVDTVLPGSNAASSFLAMSQTAIAPLTPNDFRSNLTINVNSQVIQAVRGVVAQEVNGNINFTEEDRKIVSLIEEYGGADTQDLLSDVNELSDKDTPASGRLKAKQRLLKFLGAIASKVGDVGAGVLQTYIESKMGI